MDRPTKSTMDGKTEEKKEIKEEDNIYIPDLVLKHCFISLEILETISERLISDDRRRRSYRRSLGVTNFIKKELIPMITSRLSDRIDNTAIRLFASLTIPTECLLRGSFENNVQFDLDKMLEAAKEAFLDSQILKVLLEKINRIIHQTDPVTSEEMEMINNTILLFRNILHIPLTMKNNTQNQLVWNFSILGGTQLLIDLMNSDTNYVWAVSLVQLLAIIYKDQDVSTITELLGCWANASTSESSDDNESNTTPKPSDLTTDLTTNNDLRKTSPIKDEKINESKSTKTLKGPLSSSELSDYGYGTQIETQAESVSSSCNEEEQIPHKRSGKTRTSKGSATKEVSDIVAEVFLPRESKLKKIIKPRSIMWTINQSHHKPTDEDLKHLMKEFTINMFVQGGFGQLVKALYLRIMSHVNNPVIIDTSHFYWLVTYFLKFASLVHLELRHIMLVLSPEIVGYLTFEAVNQFEQLKQCIHSNEEIYANELNSCLRRMYLVVTALTEFFKVLCVFETRYDNYTEAEVLHFMKLQKYLRTSDNIRNTFVMLIMQWDPNYLTKQYLQNLVEGNHNLILLIDDVLLNNIEDEFFMLDHLNQFANFEVMYHYGELLTDFENNSEFLNDCILTMMHHVVGELDMAPFLFQCNIITAFSIILEKNLPLREDWNDLANCLVAGTMKNPDEILTEKKYREFKQDFIDPDLLTKSTDISREKNNLKAPKNKIQEIASKLQANCYEFLRWVQRGLIDASYAKYWIKSRPNEEISCIVEPIPYHYAMLEMSIPLVPFNVEHFDALQFPLGLQLLEEMGLELSTGRGKGYPRIPHSWTPEYIFDMAQLVQHQFPDFVKERYEEWINLNSSRAPGPSPTKGKTTSNRSSKKKPKNKRHK